MVAALMASGILIPATPALADPAPALEIELVGLNPAVMPASGQITVAGRVTNPTKDLWEDINVYATVSATPLRTPRDIAAAYSATDGEAGLQVVTTISATIDSLEAEGSAPFSFQVPRELFGKVSAPASYWIGAAAFGGTSTSRDDIADARGRALITALPKTTRPTSIALTMPVRGVVRTHADGTPLKPAAWTNDFAESGRLGAIANLINAAPERSLSLLVDPAIPDLASRVAKSEPNQTHPELPDLATTWLDSFTIGAQRQDVVDLGYGDPDVAALSRLDPRSIAMSYRLSAQVFHELQLPSGPGVAPPDGVIPNSTLAVLPSNSRLIVDANRSQETGHSTETVDGHVISFAAASPARSLLELRQWILAQGSMRMGSPETMVVTLPSRWNPGSSSPSRFFAALDRPWLNLASLPLPADQRTVPLIYPETAARAELGAAAIEASKAIGRAGRRYQATVLTEPTNDFAAMALQPVSYQARLDRRSSLVDARALHTDIVAKLSGIRVDRRPPVNLAGGSGTILVTIVNELDVPVSVGLRADRLTPGLTISEAEPVQLRAHQRTTVRLKADAKSIGVYSALLTPVNENGSRVGTPLPFVIRSSNVTRWVWVIMAAGAAVLFGAIGRRVVKKTFKPRSEPEGL